MKKSNFSQYPWVIIGAGLAGLTIALEAAKHHKKVLLIEASKWGGSYLNHGAIPRKTFLEAAKHARSNHSSVLEQFGLSHSKETLNTQHVFKRVQTVTDFLKTSLSPEHLQKRGIDTHEGQASFITPTTLSIFHKEKPLKHIQFEKAFITTGSKPSFPVIEGLHNIRFLTGESIFTLSKPPKSLAIIGGGCLGCELAQGFARLGSKVTIFEQSAHLLFDQEEKVGLMMQKILENEQASVHPLTRVQKVEKSPNGVILQYLKQDTIRPSSLEVENLLIATGHEPNLSSLNLDKAQVAYTAKGIKVDSYCQTSQKHIWALGDVIGHPYTSQKAQEQARLVVHNQLNPSFFTKRSIENLHFTSTLETDPGIASIGLTEKQAFAKYSSNHVKSYYLDLCESDCAITAENTLGFIQIHTNKRSGKILGASIVAPHAAELISLISMAIGNKLSINHLSKGLYPHPSYAALFKKLNTSYPSFTFWTMIEKFENLLAWKK